MKIFGDYLTLDKKIEEMPNTVDGLIGYIFLRLNKEFEDDLIKKVTKSGFNMKFIITSSFKFSDIMFD